MYFKKLDLIGFKSFMQKTTLHFEPGITAIVGPNGCGKSNLFDSIRWVLGEQSVKALRGSEMQDVIFNGTDAKEPLSMAEVNLTFDNRNRFFNTLPEDEVMISRRIFRSGESEYILNKSPVRLKDIMDLLMGTGIGAESYSLVEQGKIDLLLSAKPEDRRLVFDEAAGITKYKAQKKESLRKLEETEQNLLRVNDIITEVKRQITSLERQASKARRYKETFEELKSKEINLASWQQVKLKKQKDEIINHLNEIETQEKGLLQNINQAESKISNRQLELKALEDNIVNIKEEISRLENLILREREHIRFNQERIKESAADKTHLVTQIIQTQHRLAIDEEKLNKVKEEYVGIQQNIDQKKQDLKNNAEELTHLGLSIRTALENISRAKKDILELVSAIARVKNEIADWVAKQQIYFGRQKRLEVEKAKVNEEKNMVGGSLEKIAQELESLDKDFQASTLKITQLKDELEKEGLALNQLNVEIANLERQRLTLESQQQFLKRLKTEYNDIGESMNAVIYLDKLSDKQISGLVVKIKERLFLSKEEKEQLKFAQMKLSGEVKPVDLDTQHIGEKIRQIEIRLRSLKNEKLTKENHCSRLNKSIQDMQDDLHNQEILLSNKRALQNITREQFNKIKEEEEIVIIELADVEKELKDLDQEIVKRQANLAELDKKHKKAEQLISDSQEKISTNNNLKEKALVKITQTKTEIDGLTKRISSDQATLKILEDNYHQDQEAIFNLQRQTQENQQRQESLDREIKDLEEKIKKAQDEIKVQNQELKQRQVQHEEISIGIQDTIKSMESERKEINTLKDKLHQLQMQDKDVDFKLAALSDRILQVYKVDLREMATDTAQKTEEEVPPQEIDQEFAQEIQRLKEKLDAYGSVNLVAIEEYDELKKRYDFLNQQQHDLVTAKGSLHAAILKINRTTKKMFQETFQKVSQEFRSYFKLLFNGGDAQIFLIDEQDPLESGIEIICRPPGKKLQNVLLLSGGEKSLSAIALIFAIFKIKPSPFCVLDEIDASLDEANVDRYSRLLQEFTKTAQFIVITHNKRTIVNADVMYGITMEESGISKIVSVKFAKDKELKEEEQETVPEPV